MTAPGDSSEFAPRAERRGLLETAANPGTGPDYLSLLEGHAPGARARVTIRYVPDKRILTPAAYRRYLAALEAPGDMSRAPEVPETPEALALMILEDMNNEVVPRWVQVVVAQESGEDAEGGARHVVLVEDRQPKWDDPALLARLVKF